MPGCFTETDWLTFANAAGVGLWQKDLESGEVRCADEAARVLGLSPGDTPRTLDGLFRHVHPADRDRFRAGLQTAIELRAPLDAEFGVLPPGGMPRWAHCTGKVFIDDTTRGARFAGVVADVTARRAAQEASDEAEERLRLAQEAGGVGTWEWDVETGEFAWSEENARLHGRGPDHRRISFEEWLQLLHPDDRAPVRRELEKAADGAHMAQLEFRTISTDTPRWLLGKARAALPAKDRKLVRGANIDITQRKRAEQAMRSLNDVLERKIAERTADLAAANRELEAFTYSVSHDLRAPLRAISGFSRILNEEHGAELGNSALAHLTRIQNSAERMGRLIDDLLQFSRIGRVEMQREEVDPAELARQAWDDLRVDAADRPVELVIPELPRCSATPSLLRQVYANLLSNALKFTRPQPAPRIELGYRTAPGEPPAYWVRDNGVGFDERYQHKLFGVFQRLHTREEFEGSGVGLAIVQRVVHRHGGRAWAESKPGCGATFCFTLG